MSRKICVVTGSRAEYGLLRWVMTGIQETSGLVLQVIATGMHLSPEFGLTYREIEKDGFTIDAKVEMLLSADSTSGLSKSMGLGLMGFADVFTRLQPDMVLVLGDRFDIFPAAVAAMIARIPIAHLHGGETSEGAFDEAIRHAITKMAHWHFVAAGVYRERVIQLGEAPERVFLVGGLGIDNIKKLPLLSRFELEESLGLELKEKNLLITFHPVTLETEEALSQQINALLTVLGSLNDTRLIFTLPNADTHSRLIIEAMEAFVAVHANAYAFTSLGQLRYLSCLQYMDGVIGNSSSGLIEVPSFKKGTINIGDRERGRLKAASVIDCEPTVDAITEAISLLYSPTFQARLKTVINPYGEGGASEKIVQVLSDFPLDGILKKPFHDLHGLHTGLNHD